MKATISPMTICRMGSLQGEWGRRWQLSSDGMLIASVNPDRHAPDPGLRLYDRSLQEIFSTEESTLEVTHTPLGLDLIAQGSAYPPDRPPAAGPPAYSLYRHQDNIVELMQQRKAVRATQALDGLLDNLAWNGCMGVLGSSGLKLYFKVTPEAPWQHQGIMPLCAEKAVWCPDGTSVLFSGRYMLSILSCKTGVLSMFSMSPWDLHSDLGSESWGPVACSPCGHILAMICNANLILMEVESQRVLYIKHPSTHPGHTACIRQNVSLCWNAAGDKLMVSWGGCWEIMCFGGSSHLLGQDKVLADLLEQASAEAADEPALSALMQPVVSSSCFVAFEQIKGLEGQMTLGSCPGWEAFV